MKNRHFVYGMVIAAIVFAGCAEGGPHPKILPQDTRKIYVKPVVNSTSQYGLEDKLTLAVTNEMINDGRYALVNSDKDADCILSGEIAQYTLEPLTYSAGAVTQQYKLVILAKVRLDDKAKNVALWSEPMEGIQIYYDASQPGGMSEEEARGVIWDNMSRDIARRVTDALSAEKAASEKKAPESK